MPLSVGTRLGPYEIVSTVGAGGMGEVYKARDTRLGRDVAIKLLHAAISADPEARSRFEREARTISQLNHPNICVLYDVGAEADASYLVMEFLEGESLAARIARGKIPPEEALDCAMQIADALDKAHRQGIVHRDLKPANVMLVKTGAARGTVSTTLPGPSIVKLLDFGLAKLVPPPTAGSLETVLAASQPNGMSRGTLADPPTAQGTILGTFQYMAPEQVEAREVDARADIWAFGCVLHEMLTGRRAFEGRTQASMIASILERDPTPVAELQPLTPAALARVVRICLAKDPDARFQSAYDLLLQLQWIAEGGSAVGLPAPVIAHRKRRERALWSGVAILTLAIGAATAWGLKPAPVVSNVIERFSFALPEGQAFTRTGRRSVAISPDGKRMAYIADKQLFLREMHQLAALPITGTAEDPLEPAFSPDGLWIAYFVSGGVNFTLKKIQVGGGTPVTICPTGWPFGLSWQGNTLVFGQNSEKVRGVQSVPDAGGTPTTLVTVGATETVTQPHLLANGLVLFTVGAGAAGAGGSNWDDAEIVLQAPGEATRSVLVKGGTDARVVAGDRLVYYKGGTLFGMGVDLGARATRGGPVPIIEGVRATTSGSGAAMYAVADSGTLVFVPGSGGNEPRQLVWVDRQGKEELIPAPEREYFHPRLSPSGDRIVVAVQNADSANLYTWELGRKVFSQLTSAPDTNDSFPLWTPAGDSVIYRSSKANQTRIMRVSASGASAPQLVLEVGGESGPTNGSPESISQDGKTLTFRRYEGANTTSDVFALSLDAIDQAPRPLLAGPMSENLGMISPDGRWLLYSLSDAASGTVQVFMRPYPNVESDRRQVSPMQASDAIWARSGREIYFIDTSNKVHAVPVGPEGALGQVVDLFDNAPYRPVGRPGVEYDAAPDGRFLMVKTRSVDANAGSRQTITIVTHWMDELKARVK